MSTLPPEIAAAPAADLKFNATDPDTAAKLRDLMLELKGEKDPAALAAGALPGSAAAAENPRLHVPANTDFDIPVPGDRLLQEALPAPEQMPITEDDKATYLKALLTDSPMRLSLSLYGGRLTVELRARYNREQRRIFDILNYEQDKGITPKDNPAYAFNRIQLFCAALMVERMNGRLISELVLKPGSSLEQDRVAINQVVEEKFEAMTLGMWTAVLQAMRVFEYKCARLNEEALNEGFWNPRGPEV